MITSTAVVVGPPEAPQSIHRRVYRVYKARAQTVFLHRFAVLRRNPAIAALGDPISVTVRLMRRRWGSCFSDGRIALNPELLAARIAEIDYVILHELCYLREHNHSRRFYRLMDDLMPDWRIRRERLNEQIPIGFLRAPG